MFRSGRSSSAGKSKAGPASRLGLGTRGFRRASELERAGLELPGLRREARALLPEPKPGALSRLPDVFTPTQPKPLGPLFIGRQAYLTRLICALEEERAHVVLFGERGRGKTSLANAVALLANEAGHLVLRQTCGAGTTFEGLFRAALAAVPPEMVLPPWRERVASRQGLLPAGQFGVAEALGALRCLTAQRTLLILDEFDRIGSEPVRTALTEAMKAMSDLQMPVNMLLVGVAESLEDLLGRHPSIERNVLGVHLVRMTADEIARLVDTGGRATGLSFEPEVVTAIQRCSRGMPFYAHLLCLHTGRAAAERGSSTVELDDFVTGAGVVYAKVATEAGRSGHVLLASELSAAVLLWAAIAQCDEHDRFDVTSVLAAAAGRGPTETLLETALTRLADGAAAPLRLHPTAFGERFSFAHPALAHMLLLRQEAGSTVRSGERVHA